ncbi:MAG: RNA-binding protein, partial [Proteobacteria bacterium]|nr:RNA-binding protein [Pseudomonadota bacterium]
MITKNKKGFSKGYGFITFSTEEETVKVKDQFQDLVLKGRQVKV